jgi:uncharacterized protein YneF (UPF0154 family)
MVFIIMMQPICFIIGLSIGAHIWRRHLTR